MKSPSSIFLAQKMKQRFYGPSSEAWRAALAQMGASSLADRSRDMDKHAKQLWDGEGGRVPPARRER
jgi:hypothetical protein